MKVKKILWKYRPHKDGRCDVKIYVYHQSRQKHFSTGLTVLPGEKERIFELLTSLCEGYGELLGD